MLKKGYSLQAISLGYCCFIKGNVMQVGNEYNKKIFNKNITKRFWFPLENEMKIFAFIRFS